MAYLSPFSYKKSFLDKLRDYLTSVLFFAHDTEIVRLYFVADVLSAFFFFFHFDRVPFFSYRYDRYTSVFLLFSFSFCIDVFLAFQ